MATASFPDNFSKQSASYAKYRPDYPPELFAYLSTLTSEHTLAWDCATGNGQSANGLAQYYTQVIATDPSEKQLSNAMQHPRITYKVEKAEQCTLPSNSADIVTVAQALHWFVFDEFYTQVRRVLKHDGTIAVWTYGLPFITPEVDKVINHFHYNIIGDYWQAAHRLVEAEYATIPFPFEQIQPPAFTISKQLSLNDIVGLLDSWSAVQRYIDANTTNPVDIICEDLESAWGGREELKTVTFKLTLKVGRNK